MIKKTWLKKGGNPPKRKTKEIGICKKYIANNYVARH